MSNRVFIVEDDPVIRGVLVTDISTMDEFEVAAATASAREAIVYSTSDYDILLLDLKLIEGNGLDVLDYVKQSRRPPKVLILSATADKNVVVNAIKRGADGYLLKDSSPQNIAASLRSVRDGKVSINDPIGEILFQSVKQEAAKETTSSSKNDACSLTAREYQVLSLLAEGFSYKQSAAELGVSYNTVSDHVKNIYAKLEVRSRSEAVYKALDNGIIHI